MANGEKTTYKYMSDSNEEPIPEGTPILKNEEALLNLALRKSIPLEGPVDS